MQYMYELGEPPIGGENDSIIVDEGDGDGFWSIVERTYYVRDVSGKEIGIYGDTTFSQWNVWGLDNVGKVSSDRSRYYYIKDHLGSIRAVLNEDSRIANAQDYDAWGYILESRSDNPGNSKYKFTGKERDKDIENNYDYFGARYYDSRIGRWGQIDPLYDKYITNSPYVYALENPLVFKDPNGKWTARYDEESGNIYVTAEKNDKFEDLYTQLGMSKDEFFEKYKEYINDPENFELNAGFELDITELVTGNAKFENDLSNVNCFSSVFAKLLGEEPTVLNKSIGEGFSEDLSKSFGFKKESEAKTGYVKTFEDSKEVTHHAAIFVIRSQKGIEYFFGRPGPSSKLSIQTSDILNQLYPDFKTYTFSYPKIK
jgi:RHS repeat-associated protein